MFGRATIRLGIGPHSSSVLIFSSLGLLAKHAFTTGMWPFRSIDCVCECLCVTLAYCG